MFPANNQQDIANQHDVIARLNHELNTYMHLDERFRVLLGQIVNEIGAYTIIKPPVYFDIGNVKFGNHCFINRDCKFIDFGGITIGNNVGISANVTFIANDHPSNPLLLEEWVDLPVPIVIKDGVWIGAGAIIKGPVTIGVNAIIGAGSVVTKDVPSNVVVVGNPARIIETVEEYKVKHEMRNGD